VQARNTRVLTRRNRSGFRGVSCVTNGKGVPIFKTTIVIDGQPIHLGYHKTAEEASEVYINYVKANNLEHNWEV